MIKNGTGVGATILVLLYYGILILRLLHRFLVEQIDEKEGYGSVHEPSEDEHGNPAHQGYVFLSVEKGERNHD
jgi:hypothetical protein